MHNWHPANRKRWQLLLSRSSIRTFPLTHVCTTKNNTLMHKHHLVPAHSNMSNAFSRAMSHTASLGANTHVVPPHNH